MEILKGFSQQRKKPKGSMVEGYIQYEFLYYYIEYNKKIDDTIGGVVWDINWYEDKREGKLLQTMKKCAYKE